MSTVGRFLPPVRHFSAGRCPKWVTPEEAVQCIKSKDTVFITGTGIFPLTLAKAMTAHGVKGGLRDVTVHHIFPPFELPYISDQCKGVFRACSQFLSPLDRRAVAEGKVDTIPMFLSDFPKLFEKGIIKPDVSLIHVSPPDEHGFCSLGLSVMHFKHAIAHSKVVIAQVNRHMPRVLGDALVHESEIDFAVEVEDALPMVNPSQPSAQQTAIGKRIAGELISNGATLQIGIGSIPEAVLLELKGHKDLGIHSELISTGIMELIECGALNGYKKILDQGKIVATFAFGSEKFYRFLHNNPLVDMKTVDYTNSTLNISRQPKMTAINSAIEIDLTGQVSADSIGTMMFSGFGGQVDFVAGSSQGEDGQGKAIIAVESVNMKTGESKIVPVLKPGAGVVTTRAQVRYVVTEHGVASLLGKTLRQRAFELIQIASPEHREALERAAFDRLKTMPSP